MAKHIESFLLNFSLILFLLRAVYSINLQSLDLGKYYKVTQEGGIQWQAYK